MIKNLYYKLLNLIMYLRINHMKTKLHTVKEEKEKLKSKISEQDERIRKGFIK